MQDAIQNFRQSSIVFEKPGIQLSYSSILFAETSHTFSTYHCLKKDLWYFSYSGFCTLVFYTSIITQDLNKINKIPHMLLWTLLSTKRVQSFSKRH